MTVAKEHRLLVYEEISRRHRGKLLLLGLLLLSIGIYDQFTEVLGPAWWLIWIAILSDLILWIYYALLLGRTAIIVRPKHLRIQGPLVGMKVSYGRIGTVTSTTMLQHIPIEDLSGGERAVVRTIGNSTCVLIALNSWPTVYSRRHLWFSRLLFSASQPGIMAFVADWMALSRDIEAAREQRRERVARPTKTHRTLAGQILAEDG